MQTRNDLLNATVQLFAALGGGWQDAAATPAADGAGTADAKGEAK